METTAKLIKMIKHTLLYRKAMTFRFTMQYHSFPWHRDVKKNVVVALMCVRVRE